MQPDVDAGDFAAWLSQARDVLRGKAVSTVPCGTCTGCCTSGYSLEVRPEDAAALALIPVRSLFRARGATAGHWSVRPNADGTCPMLDCGRCTIYAHRPQTCQDYDCRVFTAAGIDAGADDKAVINQRVGAWRFRFTTESARATHAAVQAAAAFIRDESAHFPPGTAPRNPLGIAALALRVYSVFMPPGPAGSKHETAQAIVAEAVAFDRGEGVHA